jgi:integrase
MQPTKLTVRLLEKLRPSDRVTDTEVKGLSAEAGRTGRLKFKFKAMLPDRSMFKQTLGEYPELSLDNARRQALELRIKVQGKADPRGGTPRAPGMWTVATLLTNYLEDAQKVGGAERTASDIQTRYDDYLSEHWGALPLAAITPQMARERHESISKHGKNGDRTAPVVANDTLRNFRAAWNWARKTQPHLKLPDNPVNAVTFNKQRQRTDSLNLPDLKAWEIKVEAIKNPIRRDMHRLGLFSGLRPGVLVALERSWVHFDLKAIVVPADKMKGRKEFHLPLSRHMIEIIERIKAAGDVLFPGAPYLFPTRGNKTRVGPVIATQVWKERDMASETGHILRHIYSNVCQAAGSTGSPINKVDRMLLLAQQVPGIEGTYLNDRFLFESLLAKQEQVTAYMLKAIGTVSSSSKKKPPARRTRRP